jgi:hypothetical protein
VIHVDHNCGAEVGVIAGRKASATAVVDPSDDTPEGAAVDPVTRSK